MSAENPQDVDVKIADEIRQVDVDKEMEQSYIDYSMSVIVGRALPDVRDGLKPVQRRILHAMNEMGVSSGGGHRKSSSIVGKTMGDFHPHGDSSIYDALARMAQDFSLRQPLVDGQGNFGSLDGDSPAAMRYTEARLAPISSALLDDISKETVDWQSNYDDRLEEPSVLPAAFPNLLVNGASGIAVGMSTNVPPHNLGEVVDATTHLIDNPDCDVSDLMDYIKGPDFPTGAEIVGRDGIYDAYETGNGRVRVRAKFHREDTGSGIRLVVTEIPFQQKKGRLIEKIADDVKAGNIEGVTGIRDESDLDGVRIVIDLKRGANPDLVENQLLESHLEKTFSIRNLALVDGQPRVLTLKETLKNFIEFRRDVVRRRTQSELDDANDRAHILEGRLTALDHVDAVVETIRDSETRDAAISALCDRFDLTDAQAEHIVRMQLGSLTSMEEEDVENEYEEVQAEIERLERILNNEDVLLNVIKDELNSIKEDYGTDRRTQIVEGDDGVTREDLIEQEEVVVMLSEDDYMKRMPVAGFKPQNRDGKGVIGTDLKEDDAVSAVFTANTHDYLLLFTNTGEVHEIKAYQVPEFGRTARGTAAANIIDLDDGEAITAVVNTADYDDDALLTMATSQGYIKRTPVDEFENIYAGGIIATSLEDGDTLVDVAVSDGTKDVMLATKNGKAIRFDETEVSSVGRSARGVNGIRLADDDAVVAMVTVDEGEDVDILTVTARGYGKRTAVSEYRQQSRRGKGVINIQTPERNGPVRTVKAVKPDDHLVIMSESGQIMRIRAGDVSDMSRNTQGVRVMQLEEGDMVASVDSVAAEAMADTDE